MTEHKHKEVMIKHANDSSLTIQLWSPESGNWENVARPVFNPDVKYRVKPDKNHQLIIAAELRLEVAREALYAAQDALSVAKCMFEEAGAMVTSIESFTNYNE